MKLVLILVISALGFGACADAQEAPQHPDTAVVKPNGYFRAEHGAFSLERDILCSYSSSPSENTHSEGECYKLIDGIWKPTTPREDGRVASRFLDFGPCDPLNQLDIAVQHSELAATLPHSAAMKQVIQSDQSAIVVYSDTPDQRVRYSLRFALFISRDGKWIRIGDWPIGTDNFFCGMRLIEKRGGSVALMYLDEPAASSNYFAVRSFLLNWPR